MHDVVVNELEDYLASQASIGNASPALPGNASEAFHAHLASCPECRAEVDAIADVSVLLSELKSGADTAIEPSPFFYTRVAASIVEHQNTNHWGLLAPGAAFFRRVAFASLLLLAGLGSYLVMQQGDVAGTDAATIMAQHDVTADHAPSSDRDLILMTLASYGE